ncbi:hypothetical protein CHLRE_04g216300v5 [Chlamydomonas reinhardtii]|uniref:Proteasome assembly chaperone 3 n=1 Tax=Chlamydomonas reinhardtii TaxID=3055 RepID=A8J9P1_CHLRE|nr:uncharacterized protein CHLRE_04g216300v5 [Chlamydomonas reinhardtii]PNW83898.1 hypothetical protein CHLRE_04g216300v5 [Chlamydomonas reinhardtii]|eukprot:XP_001698652.1 predicted protein [Chlamydomonas reinhardtii]
MERLGELAEGLPGGQNDADSEPGPALAPPCSPRVAPTARQRNFSTTTHDAALNFQLLDLGRQYFVWVSAVGPKLGSLTLAIKSPADAAPSVASLLPGAPAVGEGPAMAQRLAIKLGKPVVCSCNMPPNSPLLQAVAERRLLQELQLMEQEAQGAAGQATGGEVAATPAAVVAAAGTG